jgi:hypothetical protein
MLINNIFYTNVTLIDVLTFVNSMLIFNGQFSYKYRVGSSQSTLRLCPINTEVFRLFYRPKNPNTTQNRRWPNSDLMRPESGATLWFIETVTQYQKVYYRLV